MFLKMTKNLHGLQLGRMLAFGSFKVISILFVCVVFGCGSDSNIASVSGIVTFEGEPLEGATVMFFPESGRGSIGLTRTDGSYVLAYTATTKGAVIGTHKVTISIEAPDELGEDSPPPILRKLPAKYASFEKTELTANVIKGSNKIDFSLTK